MGGGRTRRAKEQRGKGKRGSKEEGRETPKDQPTMRGAELSLGRGGENWGKKKPEGKTKGDKRRAGGRKGREEEIS